MTKTETGNSIYIKLYNKVAALDRLGKHLGMFNGQANQNGVSSNVQIIDLTVLINSPAADRAINDNWLQAIDSHEESTVRHIDGVT